MASSGEGSSLASPLLVIDTDLGDDIDDTWALAQALQCEEFRVGYVLTAGHGDHQTRARIAAKVLDAAGAPRDIAIGLGVVQDLPEGRRMMFQEKWAEDMDLTEWSKSRGQVHEDGVGGLLDLVRQTAEPVTVLAIGPLDNIVECLRRDPTFASRCYFVSMLGSVYKGYDGDPNPIVEFNVRKNPLACREVLAAPWLSKTIAPLDTAGLLQLTGAPLTRLLASTAPLARAVVSANNAWLDGMSEERRHRIAIGELSETTSTLFDSVAVHLCRGSLSRMELKVEPLRIDVTDEGMTVPTEDPSAPLVHVATDWNWKDFDSFCEDFVNLLTSNEKRSNAEAAMAGGHDGGFRFYKHLILKKMQDGGRGQVEGEFLQAALDHPVLSNFVPRFEGIFSDEGGHWMKMQNISASFAEPAILDLKMGTQTWEPGCTQKKLESQQKKAKLSTTGSHGVRVVGGKLRTEFGSLLQGVGYKYEKEVRDESELINCLQSFLVTAELRAVFKKKVEELYEWFSHQTEYAFYASSLLLSFDSKIEHPTELRIAMIDFTHVHSGTGKVDDSYLTGLANLRRIMAELV